jgi:pyruvate dehydrogenase E2 component (dihydrolipoamide acetyltransferase)
MPSYEEGSGAPHLADDAETGEGARRPARREARAERDAEQEPAATAERDEKRDREPEAPTDGEATPPADGGRADAEGARPDGAAAKTVAAPSVRRLARELGIDISEVTGTAGEGRVSAEDVYRHVRRKLAALETSARPAETERDYSRWGEARVEPMSTVRRRTAEQMSLAWSTIPHVTHHDLADITELDRLRRQFAPRVEKAGGKLTVTAVLLKVVGSALRRYPKFNATVDMENAAVIYKGFVNVGVAVDTERGLLVPVIRGVDEKNIVEIALELKELSEAARARKIRPEMLQGATFTVTNLGGIGGTQFSPLINPPEVAVLGAARAEMRQTWVDGKPEPRLLLPLSVSYDHRIIDGADAARFLRWVCEAMAEPFLMDLEGE